MKRFRFPLAKVHGWRAQQERMARRELGAALSELSRIESVLGRVRADIVACRDEAVGIAAALADALEVGLVQRERVLEQQQGQAATTVDVARDAYLARRRDLRTLSRLYDARREAWRRECTAEEQKEMEDVLRIRGPRPQREESQR